MDIFKRTIRNAAYMKALQIFPSAKEWLSIRTSRSISIRNQSCLHCSGLHTQCESDLNFCMWLHSKNYMAYPILKQPFLHHFSIFNSVIFFMLSTSLLMHGQIIFADSHGHCAMTEGGEDGHFWCEKGHRSNRLGIV